LRAIARSRSRPHLFLRGNPARGFVEKLHAMAAELGISDRLHILARTPPSEMERLASTYDVGFCGEPGQTRNRRISLTNKMFSFVLAGVPIVASDVPSHVGIAPSFEEAIRLFRADDADDLARALDHYLLQPEVLARARKKAFALGQSRFNWDVEQKALLECVARVLRPAVAA
jgi:glycosyltransferase involved in cell wall biosynthesis